MTTVGRKLLVLDGAGNPLTERVLDADELFVGRDPQCEIRLNDLQVSWRHARVRCAGDEVSFEDLDSTNGSYLGAKRIRQVVLRGGDVIEVGPFRLVYQAGRRAPSVADASERTLAAASPEALAAMDLGTRPAADLTSPPIDGTRPARPARARASGWLTRVLPIAGWLPAYRREDLRADLGAGLTVAIVLVPQALAYAVLAGLPPVVGLYACVLPMLAYAVFGTSRQLSVAPVAIDSILVAVGVGALAVAGSEVYRSLALTLALMVGVLQVGLGILRAGFVVNFLSYPVMSGFTSAAVLIIAFSQLKHLLGVSLPQTHQIHLVVLEAWAQRGSVNTAALALGLGGIASLLALKRWLPAAPGPLLVVATSTLVVIAFGLEQLGLRTAGEIPAGLPIPRLPDIRWERVDELLPLALTVALVGYAQSISVAKTLAQKQGQDVDPSQELLALGVSNAAAAFGQGYTVSGGMSRSAVAARAGARTQMTGVFAAALIAATLAVLTPLFRHIPYAALAAVVIVAVIALIDIDEVRYLFRVKRSEGALLSFTFAATLALGVVPGLLAGMAASLLLFLVLNTRPPIAVLGRLPGTMIFRNVEAFPEAQTIEGLVILRVDASFYFANAEFLKNKVRTVAREYGPGLRAIVVDAGAINDLDSTGDTALHQIAHELAQRGVELYIAGVKSPVRDVMKRSGLYEVLGGDHFFFTIDAAVQRFQARREAVPAEPGRG